MKAYKVIFQQSEDVYCTNIVYGEKDLIEKYYSNKYQWVKVKEASESDLREAEEKHMPIIKEILSSSIL